jgi:hypothetical protein
MSYFVFEDRIGKLCSKFDLTLLNAVYPHWDLKQSPQDLFDIVCKELIDMTKQSQSYQKQNSISDPETKRFLVYHSNGVLLQLKRLKMFLEDGISKGYKLVLD